MTPPRPGDKSAAFTGLLVSVVFLLVTCATIVHLTPKKFVGHARPAAGAAPAQGH
jgi:hypothetical protein